MTERQGVIVTVTLTVQLEPIHYIYSESEALAYFDSFCDAYDLTLIKSSFDAKKSKLDPYPERDSK